MSDAPSATSGTHGQQQTGSAEMPVTFTAPSRSMPDLPVKRQLSTRHRRPPLIAFVGDTTTEAALCDGLTEVTPGGLDVRRGGIQAAIASMRKSTTPSVLIVDISGEEQPLAALAQLADVVEPDVCVLVIGDVDSVDFFHAVTGSLGAQDYLSKPLTSDKVARHFGALVAGPSGLEALSAVLDEAPAWLAPGATLVAEIAPHQASAAQASAKAAGFAGVLVRPDLAGRQRVLVARR